MKRRVRILKPVNRLSELVARPGGLPRPAAIAKAQARLEAQRGPAMQAIGIFVATLEEMLAAPPKAGNLRDICRVTDRLISLAALYDMPALAEGGKRLCDLAAAFIASGDIHAGSLAVHVRALRLLAMDAPAPGVLAELDKVLAHFGARPAGQ